MKKFIISKTQLNYIVENQERVDNILDKIKKSGLDSLRPSEKKYLDAFSKYEGHPEDFKDPNYEEYDDRKGEKFVSDFRNLPQIEFVFDYEEKENDEIHLYGKIFFVGQEYVGVIVTNNKGNLIDYDFHSSDIDYNNPNPNRLVDDMEGFTHELEVFLEDEVIPGLI
jgi:hypothetical protein